MQTAEIRRRNDDPASTVLGACSDPSPDPYDVLLDITIEALHKAKERGHMSGYDRQDWLDAEGEVLAQVYGLTGSAC